MSGGGRSLRIGMIDLDTSHPPAFLPLVRELGHDVVAVCDRGTVHDEGFAAEFAERFGVESVAAPADMLGRVDAVFVHSVDWDQHVATAGAFVEAGVPVLIDKPMVGSAEDLRTVRGWLREGAVITGGSALRWCLEAERARSAASVEFATVWCAGHPLDYGIHGHSLAVGLLGPGVAAVRHLGDGPWRAELRWRDGRTVQLVVAEPGHAVPFRALVLTADGASEVGPATDRLYASLLAGVLPVLSGQRPPEPPDDVLAAEAAALAALASAADGGRWVDVDDVPPGTHYDGSAFAAGYRARTRSARTG